MRKKPFSGAQKKKQLQEKRARQRGEEPDERPNNNNNGGAAKGGRGGKKGQPRRVENNKNIPERHRLRTVFEKETKEEIEERKKLAMAPIVRNSANFVKKKQYFGESLDIPLRPPWDYSQSKDKLEENEERYFDKYLDNILDKYSRDRINYFERNLNVWRQLWRVCETSDIFCVLADCRHPLFHFPPSLYRYVHHVLKKPMILVLTKTDLVKPPVVEQWVEYFKGTFPALEVVAVHPFSKFKVDLGSAGKKKKKVVFSVKNRYNGQWSELIKLLNRYIVANDFTPLEIPEAQLEQDEQKPKSNKAEAEKATNSNEEADSESSDDGESSDEDDSQEASQSNSDEMESQSEEESEEEESSEDEGRRKKKGRRGKGGKNNTNAPVNLNEVNDDDEFLIEPSKRSKKNYITIGFIGSPNVGKSSLINAFKGKKVCSESRTPGHTKHRQTLFINPTVVFADCPGLVFPAVDIPKQMQILCGIFPIAQVREPYSTIQYLAEHIPIEEIYRLKKDPENTTPGWSAFEIADAYATKRGYFTKNGRPNTHKAGSEILYDVIDGRIEWYFTPDMAEVNVDNYVFAPVVAHDPASKEGSESEEEEKPMPQRTERRQKKKTLADSGYASDVESSDSESQK